ncbi:MAG: hypothetical protein R2794_10450 [Chitinophagales bacterium]
MRILIGIAITCMILSSCAKGSKDMDAEGRLLATKLVSETGDLNFQPMLHSDSSYVMNYVADVYTYEDKPYTGEVAAYNAKEKLVMTGACQDGYINGLWTFYYPSGHIQVSGTYTNGMETGFWTSFYSEDKPKIIKYYDEHGYMLMRKEFYDNGKIKNYQNVSCPQFGGRERRVQFKRNGEIEYLDAERELGKIPPAELNDLLVQDKLMTK